MNHGVVECRDPSSLPVQCKASCCSSQASLQQLPSPNPRLPPALLLSKLHTVLLFYQVRDLIYREVLEYHPQMLADFLAGGHRQPNFVYPSAVDNFKRQFAHLEGGGKAPGGHLGQATSLPRERVREFQSEAAKYLRGHGGTQHMSGGWVIGLGQTPARGWVGGWVGEDWQVVG